MPEENINGRSDEKGRLVEFPSDEIRMPTQELPHDLGRIDDSHPLQKPLRIAIVILGFVIVVMIGSAILTSFHTGRTDSERPSILESYRESGTITYMDERIEGWFLEETREHFMDNDGNRYTYVDSHTREGARVMGYWRKLE